MDKLTRRAALALGASAAAFRLPLIAAPTLPRTAPELVMRRGSGELILLSKCKGKVVLLELLLTTCPHCQHCAQVVQKVWEEYQSRGVLALGAAVNDEARNDLLRFEILSGAKFPIGVSDRVQAYKFLQADMNAGPVYFPQLVFVDRQGMIRAQYEGSDEFFRDEEQNIKNMLEMLLKEHPTGGAR
jgi:peroxiredoxin